LCFNTAGPIMCVSNKVQVSMIACIGRPILIGVLSYPVNIEGGILERNFLKKNENSFDSFSFQSLTVIYTYMLSLFSYPCPFWGKPD
jgi:hypothetical protein